MNQAEIDELVSAGIAKDQEDIDELVSMLKATLWVLEHPEVNALNFCGSPRLLALKARNILSKHAEKARQAELPMVEPVHIVALRNAWAGFVNLSSEMEPGPLREQMRKHAEELRGVLDEQRLEIG